MPIPQLPDFVMKCLCTLDGAMNLTFQMNQPSSMFVAREIKLKLWWTFSDGFYPPFRNTPGRCNSEAISLFWFFLCIFFLFTGEIFNVLFDDTKSGEKKNYYFHVIYRVFFGGACLPIPRFVCLSICLPVCLSVCSS